MVYNTDNETIIKSNVERSLSPLHYTRSLMFKRFLFSVWGVITFYTAFYSYVGANISAWICGLGVVLFSPITYWLEKKGYKTSARVFFILCCNSYIYFSSLGLGHNIAAEYYYFPAIMLALLLFEDTQKKEIIFSIFVSFSLWLSTIYFGTKIIPAEFISHHAPFSLMKSVNFIGAFLISITFQWIFMRNTFLLKDLLVKEVSNETEKLHEAQSIAKIGSWSYDFATKKQTWSLEQYKIFEINKNLHDDLLLKSYRDRIHQKDIRELDKLLFDAKHLGKDFIFNHRISLDDGGRVKHVQCIGKVFKDKDGTPIYIAGTSQDLTTLIDLQEQYQFILDSMGMGVWRYNPITQELVWDKSLFKLYEIDEKSFSGHYQAWESLLSPEAKNIAIKELQQALLGEREFSTTFEIVTKTGIHKHIGGKGTVIRNDQGQPIMMYGVNWDRTREVWMEKSLEQEKSKAVQNSKLASLGEMSAGVAHEINNPLSVIANNLSILEFYRNDKKKYDDTIATMNKSINRIEKIVKGLKKFSRTSEEKLRKIESLSEIISETVTLVQAKANKYQVEIETNIAEEIYINCDIVEMEQVFVNLLSNAIDAIKDLPTRRWLTINCFENDGNPIVQIIDAGQGISEEIEGKLFQPFFTTKPIGEGTGLGLSITKGILDQHQASIRLNRKSSNTCFEIQFPQQSNFKKAV